MDKDAQRAWLMSRFCRVNNIYVGSCVRSITLFLIHLESVLFFDRNIFANILYVKYLISKEI